MELRTRISIIALAAFAASSFALGQQEKERTGTERARIEQSGNALQAILEKPERDIPKNVLNRAKCLMVIPSDKSGGGNSRYYGRGVMSCRTGADYSGSCSAPIMMVVSGGTMGVKSGPEPTDFVIIVTDGQVAKRLLSNKVTVGTDASAAPGPVRRDTEASANASMQSQVLSYWRPHGVFSGVSVAGTTLQSDSGADKKLYGREVSAEEIVEGKVSMPPEAEEFIAQLRRRSK